MLYSALETKTYQVIEGMTYTQIESTITDVFMRGTVAATGTTSANFKLLFALVANVVASGSASATALVKKFQTGTVSATGTASGSFLRKILNSANATGAGSATATIFKKILNSASVSSSAISTANIINIKRFAGTVSALGTAFADGFTSKVTQILYRDMMFDLVTKASVLIDNMRSATTHHNMLFRSSTRLSELSNGINKIPIESKSEIDVNIEKEVKLNI